MPTYDYVCDGCDHAFEQWQSFHDDHLTTCPKCKKKKLRRLIGTGAAILFKGSGFYETDYNRGADYQSKAKADAESPKPSDSKQESGSASTDAASSTGSSAAATDKAPAKKSKK